MRLWEQVSQHPKQDLWFQISSSPSFRVLSFTPFPLTATSTSIHTLFALGQTARVSPDMIAEIQELAGGKLVKSDFGGVTA